MEKAFFVHEIRGHDLWCRAGKKGKRLLYLCWGGEKKNHNVNFIWRKKGWGLLSLEGRKGSSCHLMGKKGGKRAKSCAAGPRKEKKKGTFVSLSGWGGEGGSTS